MSTLVSLTVFPMDKGESVSPYVTRVVRLIRESGLPHKVGPMSTVIEGGTGEVMALVRSCFEELERDCDRVYMILTADYRKGGEGRIEKKVRSVLDKLEEKNAKKS
jgi:uncharacterized protein (TIGR00106 family)